MTQFTSFCSRLLLLCLVASLLPLSAQTTGTLTGTVTADGAEMPSVVITVTSPALVAGSMSTVSNANGRYRLPGLTPGTYEVKATMAGFQTAVRKDVTVQLGQVIVIDLVLAAEGVTESLVVTGETPIKVQGNEVGQNFSQAELKRLPVTHEVNDLINYAPGINGDRAYGATGESANGFNLDGVDVSDPGTGEHWMLPHMDWVQEIQITGLGANAEHGGYTGALYNVITRSGGNEMSGSVSLYYSGDSLVSENTPGDNPDLAPTSLERDVDLAVSLGGPIKKNKIWYFVSAQRAETEDLPLGALRSRETRLERYLFKLTAQATAMSRITALVDYDGKETDYRGIGRDVLPDAATFQDSPNASYNLTWDLITGNSGLLTTKLSGFTGGDDRLSAKGQNVPGRTDLESGIDSENNAYTRFQDKRRFNLSSDYTFYASNLLGKDNHTFKVGLAITEARHEEHRFRNGGFTYVDDTYPLDVFNSSSDLDDYLNNPLDYAFSSDRGNEIHLDSVQETTVAYIQDSIEWDRITVQAGLRYTDFSAGFKGGNESVYTNTVLAPRFGMSFDLNKDRTTSLKVHYGRYYESMFAYLYDREISGGAFEAVEYFDYNGDPDNPAWDIPAGGRSATLAQLDEGIEHPYVDQYLITLEHSTNNHTLFGLDLISRKSRDIIAMINTNSDYDVLTAGGNPLGADLPFYDLLSHPEYQLTNPEDAYRDYEAVMLRYERRHKDGWMLRGSLVWADLQGNAFAGDSYVDEWEDQNGLTFSDGKLPGFSEWEFKLSGAVDLPYDFELGGHYRFLSGEYWTPSAQIRGLFRNDRQSVFLTERGSQQLPDRHSLDLKLSRRWVLNGDMRLDTYLDFFNVTNEDTVLELDERWGTYYYDYQDHPGNSEWVDRSAYQETLRIERPREIRFGSRLSF